MRVMGFPARFVDRTMECVRSPAFSISINDSLEGFFRGKRGVRQGDPMSPYLFVIAMEVFSGIMKKLAVENRMKWHPKCEALQLSHLAFTDDLFIFSKADRSSVMGIKEGLCQFQRLSGLTVSERKSNIFFGGCSNHFKNTIKGTLGFQEGVLPVRYLGLPLVSNMLKVRDCRPLIEKNQNKGNSLAQ